MRTVIEKAIESETENNKKWLFPTDNTEDTEYEKFENLTEERQTEIANNYGVKPLFLIDLASQMESMAESTHNDLVDIWKTQE